MSEGANDLQSLAVEVATAAGRLLLEHRDRVLAVRTKSSSTDPVTEADDASEALIAEHLVAARPRDGLLGEEGASRPSASGVTWVVDPLDATVNFTYGLPHWCVSVAAEDAEGPLVGVVVDPVRDEVFAAARGAGATCNGQRLVVSDAPSLAQSLVATGFAYDPDVRASQGRDVADLLTHVRDVRRGGSAALDLAYVAAGRVDAYVEFGLQPWDWAAGRLLVTEAGGMVTPHRRRLGPGELTGIVAGGRVAHDAVASWLTATAPGGA